VGDILGPAIGDVTRVDWRDEGVYPDHMLVDVELDVAAANLKLFRQRLDHSGS
jgi:hypothetical protein